MNNFSALPSPAAPAKRPVLLKDQDALAQLAAVGLHRPRHGLRLHLGCGEQHFDGYVNIDYPPSEHTVMTRLAADVFADLTHLDFPAQSVDEIRLHHVFEHFTRPQALALLIRWHEWLKPGGKLHIETPDIMGCVEQLGSDISYRRKQAVLRHCFGSHEAHWANHYDGWHAEKYQQVLTRLGFKVECRRWRWPHEPHLANVDAFGTKLRHLDRDALLAEADSILEESIVAEVASERAMWNVWRQAMRDQLAATRPVPTGEVVVKLQGGLGNQMFQYAAGLALARRHGARFKLDLSFLRDRTPREHFTQRDFCLDLFRLSADCEIIPDAAEAARRLPRHVEQQFHFDPAFFRTGPAVYLDGYFQSPLFFEPVRAEVIQTFRSFITPLTAEQQSLAAEISAVAAVCLNVRRGDFVANPAANNFHGVCDENYFRAAATLIRKRVPDAHFFIFSDDIEWCRSSDLTAGAPTTLVSHDFAGDRFGAYLQLMMACRHFILPNSTFGWWAAFLGTAPDKICIVPEPWFNQPGINTADLIPAGWETLNKSGMPGNPAAANPVAVSVVIPCYKQAEYLAEAIESVVAQTFTDWEIIVVNDGSPDATKNVFQQSVEQWPKHNLRYLEKPNGGLAEARNAGIGIAAGKYILPLDADDKLHPAMLSKTVALLEAQPQIAIAYTDLIHFGTMNGMVHAAEFDFAKLVQNNQLNYCSLYRRTLWSAVGGYRRFKVMGKVMGYEDWDFWISCGERGFKAKRIPESLLFYRTKTSSMLTNAVKHDRELRAQIVLNHPGMYSPKQVEEAMQTVAAADLKAQEQSSLTSEQQLALAEKNTRAALKLEPHNLENHRLLARILEAGGRWTEAIAACNPVLVARPEDCEIRILFARCLFEIGSLAAAELLLAEVCKHEPGNAVAAEWLAKIKSAKKAVQPPRQPSAAPSLFPRKDTPSTGTPAILIQKKLKPAALNEPSGKPPLVSVIMPTYNRPDQLAEAVRSVLKQSFTDFEIVVVNDAGTDVEPAMTPLNQSGKIILLRHETNRGLAAARNSGIQAARGRYLAYLDDDDLFYPDHLQTLVEFLASRPGTVAYTDANRAHQELIAGQWRTKRRDAAYAKDWDNDQILVDNFVPVLCFMHEKSMLDKSGRFDETLKRHEDWDLWIRLSRHFPFVRLPKITCEFTWRDNGSSMTGQSYAPFLETMRRIHSEYKAFAGQRLDLLAAQSAKREELEDLVQCQHQIPKFKIGFLSADPKVTACAYLRLTAPLDQLHARREIEHLNVCDLVDGRLNFDEPLLRQVQVIVVQRGLAAFVPYHVLRRAIPNPAVKIVFELDDALTLLPRNHQAYQHFQAVRPHLETYLKNADLVTVSTPKLKELYSHFNENIEVLPNTVDASIWLPVPPKPPRDGKLTILFSGTVTHEHDLALVERAIERIIRKFPERVEFLFWGNAPDALKNFRQIKTVDRFMPNYKDYAAHLKTLTVDLAVVPLEIMPFNRAKSPVKWLEYSACKIPGIFTNIEAYNQIVEHGKTGWLVPNTTEAWFNALEKLILDDGLRQSIAENAHKTVLAHHLLKQNTHLWTQAYERALALPIKKISHQAAQVSIIIPTFNNLNLTRQCLDSILGNTPQGLYEIIVVDNGSTDGTPAFLNQEAADGRIRAVFIHQNRGFAHGCNQGALAAKCPHLLFLNNDAVATSGWLTAMLSSLNQPTIGIVGARLLYANNTIQHAGIEFINGVPDHPHRHAPANAPEVCQLRELDMVTGACFMIHRELFLQLAGFDETYQNGVEDIDLCLRVRSAGRKVVYEPKAVVYHLEGQSVGRFNHVNENLKTFFNRWGKTFDAQTHFVVPNPVKIVPASRSLLLKTAQSDTTKPVKERVKIDWIGSFLDHGSLSHANRELADALNVLSDFQVSRISNGSLPSPAFEVQARNLRATASPDAAVTVRHAWPPDWKRPLNGKLAVIQPWEFGMLPEAWVRQACDVDEFWVPSNFVRECYLASGIPAQKVFVVPNGVDAEKFHPQAAPVKLSTQKKFKFLFVGGTIGRKGPDLLLKAYLQNFTAADDVCLVIKDFGGKSFYAGQTFESQIRVAQLSPDAPEILYLNEELPPESLPGLYTACDCFVLPYRGEGFGLPVLEAMACGLPVIVTAGGAADDFVRDEFAWRIPATRKPIGNEVSGMKLAGNGWLLEPDPFVLGKDMRYAFANPHEARERGILASHHAHQFFSWKNSAAIAAQRIRKLAASQNEPGDSTPVKAAPVKLPPVALVGQLHEARRLLGHKKLQAAWEATVTAIHRRPFNPEAFLLLAEIALAAGDAASARECARLANDFAPGWNPARQFLKKSLKGNVKPAWLKLPEKNQTQLSVCLIVKNEEKFLDQCLQSIRGLAQQIVVVDTGSTDRTVEIARAHGAEIHSFTWDDDFAAARNAALEQATGDWVLILDADEELPAEQHPHLLADLAKAGMLAYRLPLVNLEHEAEGQNYVPRLFRNAPGVFYSGRIHEQVFPSLVPLGKSWGLTLHFGTAQLLHHGYTKQMVQDRDKIRRNLDLLTRAVGEEPANANLMMNLGLELVRMNDLAGGVEKYRAAFHLMSAQKEDETAPELREVLLTQFTCQLYKIRAHGEVVQVLNSPLAKTGGLTASLHFALGLALFELKQFAAAAEQMRQCITLRRRPVFSPINSDILTTAPEHCLALSLAKSGDAAGAEKAFLAALAGSGRVADVKLDYAKFLAAQNRSIEAFHKLHELVAADSRNLAAWRTGGEIALGRPEFLEFAGNWTAEAMRYVAEDFIVSRQHAETLLLGGDMKMAAELWERLWNSERQPVILAALILCETLAGQARHAPDRIVDEPATSCAFIKWYQKLIAMRAHKIVMQINDRLDEFSRTLPTAVGMLEKALAEPQRG